MQHAPIVDDQRIAGVDHYDLYWCRRCQISANRVKNDGAFGRGWMNLPEISTAATTGSGSSRFIRTSRIGVSLLGTSLSVALLVRLMWQRAFLTAGNSSQL